MGIVKVRGANSNMYADDTVSIVSDKVTHWVGTDYYGGSGTKVFLENGTTILLAVYPQDFEKLMRKAMEEHE